MRAVNLIPRDERKGGGGGAPSGLGAYALLGALAIVLVAVALYALAAHRVNERKAELAQVRVEVTNAQTAAAALKPYGDFEQLAQQRIQSVRALADSRFDWAYALRGLSVAIPTDVHLSSLTAATAGSSSGDDDASAAGSPTIQLEGCAGSHDEVAAMAVQLRQIDGVSGVTLAKSSKGGASGCDTSFDATLTFAVSSTGAATSTGGSSTATGGAS